MALQTAGATSATAGSPMPPGASVLRNEVGIDARDLVHPRQAIRVEVRLLHAAVLQVDLAPQRRRQPEHDGALPPAPPRCSGSPSARNRRRRRCDGPSPCRRCPGRCPPPGPCTCRSLPSARRPGTVPFGGDPYFASRVASFSTSAIARLLLQQAHAELDRVFLRAARRSSSMKLSTTKQFSAWLTDRMYPTSMPISCWT